MITKIRPSCLLILLIVLNFVVLLLSSSKNFVKAIDTQDFIVNHKLYVDANGVWVMGEVINKKTVPVKNVYVRINFLFDGSTKNFSAPVGLEVIYPDRRGPFTKLLEQQEVEGYSGYTVEVERWEQSEPKPTGLIILGGSLVFSPNYTLIEVNIKNNSTETIYAFIVIAFLYDDNGFLVTTGIDVNLQDGLLPRDVTECEVGTKFANESSGVSMFVVTAESVDYAVFEEVVRIIVKKQGETFDYGILIIIPISAAIAIIVITIINIRKQKHKTSKRPLKKI